MLKEKLLSTILFVDNAFLQKYVDLIEKNISTNRQKGKTQKHHIFPKSLSNRLNIEIDNSADNLVHLFYKDHILAHYYLIYATDDAAIKTANTHAFNRLLNSQGHQLDEQSLHELLCKQQVVYEQTRQLRSEQSSRLNSGGCYVNNGTKAKHIRLGELDDYLAKGWKKGRVPSNQSSTRGKVIINDGVNEKRVLPKDLNTFLESGWAVGRITKGMSYYNHEQKPYIIMHSPELNIEKHVVLEEREAFLADGFKLGGLKRKPYKKCATTQAGKATKDKIWIHNNLQTKMVFPSESAEYLAMGWTLGRGKIKKKER